VRFQVLTAGEYDVQSCLLGYTAHSSLMMEAVRTSETSVDNHFTRQYIPEDNSEHRQKVSLRTEQLVLKGV
jgi:hypothetical protein